MSEEGDSPKITPSEGKENAMSEDNTDSSQDEVDVKDKSVKDKQNNSDKNDDKEENDLDEENDKDDDTEESEEQDSKAHKEKDKEEPKKNAKKEDKKRNDKVKSEDEEDSENDDFSEEEGKEQKKKIKEKKGKNASSSDQPEPSGKRDRKPASKQNDEKKEAREESPESKFEKSCLGDIPRIDASISRFKTDDLKLLHKLLFKEPGKTNMIKKNIRKFDGFEFTKDSDDYSKKLKELLKFETKQLKILCEMLDLPKTEKDEENAGRILDFLLEPKDTGKVSGGGRPKRSAAVRANNRGYSSHDDYSSDEKYKARSRRDKVQRTTYKEDSSSSDAEFQVSDDERPAAKSKQKIVKRKKAKSDESDDEVASPTSDDSDEGSRKKKRASKVNNKSKVKTPAKRGRKPASTPAVKKTPGRKKKKVSSEDEDLSDKKQDGSSSEDDEPLVKKSKSAQPPTDDEIKNYVKDILEGANLEEITMKTVCQKVYDHYPDFDLAHKKDFIKATVKSLIST